MKLLVVLSLFAVALAFEDSNVVKNWQQMKAMESCWGEDNMKLYMVNMKKAIARCSHEDAPELELAPYRSTYRFVNTLLNNANHMDNNKFDIIEKMMKYMQEGSYSSHKPSYRPYSRHGSGESQMDNMQMKFFMKQMMKNMMEDNSFDSKNSMTYNGMENKNDMMEVFNRMFDNKMDNKPESRMSQFMDMFSRSRSKRAAAQDGLSTGSLDLGDRLVEKLNEQKHQMENKIGNMTCVLKEMGCLNHKNELDVNGMKEEAKQYTMPSPWFKEKCEEIVDTCYEMAENLPANIENNHVVTGENFGTVNLAKLKMFMKCRHKAETKLCMNFDIKKKIESNFGPLEEIMEQTQLTEYELFPLVIQLLHGQEMEYMMGGM